MSLGENIQTDLVAAMRAKDAFVLGALRMVKAALKNKEVDKGKPLTEEEERSVLATVLKQRREAAAQFRQGGREELADKEDREATLIERYLPSPATEDEIRAAVTQAIADTGAESLRDMGKVMKATLALLATKTVDGGTVSALVKARLQPS